MNLQDLPDVVFEKILSFLSFDEISKCRMVSRRFDCSCKILLNRGFLSAEKLRKKSFTAIRASLPRRESERRHHPMSRQCDILSALETRMALLSLTFSKYILGNQFCFIPGKVLDEIFEVLHLVNNSRPFTILPSSHEILQELRDISSMAMEYFEEEIVPKNNHLVSDRSKTSSKNLISESSSIRMCGHNKKTKLSCGKSNANVDWIKNSMETLRNKVLANQKVIQNQTLLMRKQSQHIRKLRKQIVELKGNLSDVLIKLSKDTKYKNETINRGGKKRKIVDALGTKEKKRRL
uniref:F-box domain-containing protein n=1 Tax=Clastoptera arizonana TaxID=38151 RepID=A0A1B6DZM8_9HEMI